VESPVKFGAAVVLAALGLAGVVLSAALDRTFLHLAVLVLVICGAGVWLRAVGWLLGRRPRVEVVDLSGGRSGRWCRVINDAECLTCGALGSGRVRCGALVVAARVVPPFGLEAVCYEHASPDVWRDLGEDRHV
jgi:hypothetical protein